MSKQGPAKTFHLDFKFMKFFDSYIDSFNDE